MATEYKLSYTADEINKKLGKIDELENSIASSWNDLADRPFGDELVEITWDGNPDSVETKVVITEDISAENVFSKMYYCHVSDKVPSLEQLSNSLVTLHYINEGNQVRDETTVEFNNNDFIVNVINDDFIALDYGYWAVIVVGKDNLKNGDSIYPKKGVYFLYYIDYGYGNCISEVCVGLKYSGAKCIDEKFIPDTIARVSDIPDGVTSWNDLTDKPFGEEQALEPIVFDGNAYGEAVNAFSLFGSGARYLKVSDKVIDVDTLKLCTITATYFSTGETESMPLGNASEVTEKYARYLSSKVFVIFEDNCEITVVGLVFPTKGVYFLYSENMPYYFTKITFPQTIKTLDPKYLPDDIGGSSTSVARDTDDMSREEMIAFAKELKPFWVQDDDDMILCNRYECRFVSGSTDDCDPCCAATNVPDSWYLRAYCNDYSNARKAFNIEITETEYDEIWAAWNAMMGKA